jgi:hypothetical protein
VGGLNVEGLNVGGLNVTFVRLSPNFSFKNGFQ